MRPKKFIFILISFAYLIYFIYSTWNTENVETKNDSFVSENQSEESEEDIFQPELIYHEPKVK